MSGKAPTVKGFVNFEGEIAFLVQSLQQIDKNQSLANVCLVARTNQLVERYVHALQQYNIPTHKIRRSEPDNQSIPGVRVATMHRVKGLQFDRVFLVSINEGILPLDVALQEISDETARYNLLSMERSLIHVAATRAKQDVTVTYYGNPSSFLSSHQSFSPKVP